MRKAISSVENEEEETAAEDGKRRTKEKKRINEQKCQPGWTELKKKRKLTS